MESDTVLNILIAGDSWGCGEWSASHEVTITAWLKKYQELRGVGWPEQITTKEEFDQLPVDIRKELSHFGYPEWAFVQQNYIKSVLHPGLAQYLIEYGHNVVNVSKEAQSNSYAIDQIKSQDISKFDLIIWFQTDPLRDLFPYKTFAIDYTTYESLINKQNQLLTESYTQFNSFNKKVLCLGGLSKLNLQLIQSFENLVAAIPSIPEFLLPNFRHFEIAFSDWYDLVDRQFSLDDLDKLLYNKKLQDSMDKYKDLFWPDGAHPNRIGHKKIFEYLIENENIFNRT